MPRIWKSETEKALIYCLDKIQKDAAIMWQGREKQAIVALTRALDCAAVSRYRQSLGEHSSQYMTRAHRELSLMGSASAFRPFLEVTKKQSGGVPYGPASPESSRFARSYLYSCGCLVFLQRAASLEHFGLATTEELSPGHFRITTSQGAPEEATKYSRLLLRRPIGPAASAKRQKRWNKLHARMKRYVQASDGWFIRYENDWQIVNAYRERAKDFGTDFLEAEAFPDHVNIGDRSFGRWKEACEHALGRVLSHIDFAVFLHRKNPSIFLEDVLTLFVRREDIEAVWIEAGLPPNQVSETVRSLTLEHDDVDEWEQAFETPCVFYIGLGKDFLLIPCFGALANPYFSMFRHLRNRHRQNWDRYVDLREDIFRSDLASVFRAPQFIVPANGFKLRRPSGSVITDIDAVILDTHTGDLALVQLKWHDVFGFSLKERDSRRKNIVRANEWVEKVAAWTDGRSSLEVASALGIAGTGSARPPLIYVLARYSGRFSGDHVHDERASWMGWSEMLAAAEQQLPGTRSPLFEIPDQIQIFEQRFQRPKTEEWNFSFPNLKITLDWPYTTEAE